ncbi:MAG: MBL fold metallo-hydrolase [Bacteroidales bacterium]|mgnify:FL=1|nr:MBL fold metallo-hydrolase [Bacteroidales bacterium]
MVKFKIFYVNPLRVCCYLLWDETKECVIIDPGCSSESEKERITKFIAAENLKPTKVLLTHGHFDHVVAVGYMTDKYNIPYYLHPLDVALSRKAEGICQTLGFPMTRPTVECIPLRDGDKVSFGESSFEVIHTPGHTLGGVCFYIKEQNILFSGDTLFQGSIGRTDFEDGDYEQLISSITNRLLPLPDITEVYPGHGLKTTIEEEKRTNPFLTN